MKGFRGRAMRSHSMNWLLRVVVQRVVGVAGTAAMVCLVFGCRSGQAANQDIVENEPEPPTVQSISSAISSVSELPPPAVPPQAVTQDAAPKEVEVEEVGVPNDLSVFVVRGKSDGERMVFLHGLCGNPFAYALSFRNAAARAGVLIALQGNVSCGRGFRDWSTSPAQVDSRVEAAFRALGDTTALRNIIVIGYSSGGTYSELLVMRNPERYARAILIGNPRAPALYRLRKARGVVMMAGERDRHDLMKEGRRNLASKSIPTTFLVLPGATHGEMGNEAERVMGEALDWLAQLSE
jgi:pimeloyl-ACP methyl ester carboxylesterase